jgi:hypothetical protein
MPAFMGRGERRRSRTPTRSTRDPRYGATGREAMREPLSLMIDIGFDGPGAAAADAGHKGPALRGHGA